MTAKERAAFKRLDKRRDRLFSAFCAIKVWVAFPDEGRTLYNIAELVAERIEEERAAQAKEGGAQ